MIFVRFWLFSILPIFAIALDQDDDGTLVQLDEGKIRGVIRKRANEIDYWAFQEIPYAAPPIAFRRFQLPQEPEAWDGILDTKRNTKICYQEKSKYTHLNITEDCLYINVYTAVVQTGKRKFVTSFSLDSWWGIFAESSVYEYYGPKFIMDEELVVVTFNYRLGPFGFVGTDDGVVPLNIGLKDQRFAIEWVHKNIHLFGGNPEQVTLVGESAGSVSVGLHLISQMPNENLFHAVIMQSGTPVSKILKQLNNTQNAFYLGRAVNSSFTSNDTHELLSVLQNAEANDLLNAGMIAAASLEDEGLFSYRGFQAFIDKQFKQVPVLLGFNSEEWLNMIGDKNNTLLDEIDADPTLLIAETVNIAPENRFIVGDYYRKLYVGNSTFRDSYGGYVRYVSDSMFTTGICKQVELCSESSPYYFYQFAYKGKLGEEDDNREPPPGAENVAHAEEMHYIWDYTKGDLSQFSSEDQLMLRRLIRMWTNFVKYFNPTPKADPLLDNLIWPRSDPISLKYLNINTTFEIRENPRQYKQIKKILESYMETPYNTFS